MELCKKPFSGVDFELSGLHLNYVDKFFVRNIYDFVEDRIGLHFARALVAVGEAMNIVCSPPRNGPRAGHTARGAGRSHRLSLREFLQNEGRNALVIRAFRAALLRKPHDFSLDDACTLPRRSRYPRPAFRGL